MNFRVREPRTLRLDHDWFTSKIYLNRRRTDRYGPSNQLRHTAWSDFPCSAEGGAPKPTMPTSAAGDTTEPPTLDHNMAEFLGLPEIKFDEEVTGARDYLKCPSVVRDVAGLVVVEDPPQELGSIDRYRPLPFWADGHDTPLARLTLLRSAAFPGSVAPGTARCNALWGSV